MDVRLPAWFGARRFYDISENEVSDDG